MHTECTFNIVKKISLETPAPLLNTALAGKVSDF